MYEDIEHSPDWGASFDAWTAVFLELYAQQWGDKDGWIQRRLPLLVRGLTLDGWQEQTVPSLRGMSQLEFPFMLLALTNHY